MVNEISYCTVMKYEKKRGDDDETSNEKGADGVEQLRLL